MATLFLNSSGNFTTAATWSLVDSTSFLNSETANTALTTSFVGSSTFTPGAITIDGIALKVFSRSASPTGTMIIELFNNTLAASVAGTTVTINVSDISNASSVGWVFFKFSAPVTLLVANLYSVRARTTSTAQVNLYRDGTAGNWSRCLRTTTTQAPAAADVLLLSGEYVSAGVNSTFTLTMDNTTSATTFGTVEVSSKSILRYGTAASTNYHLKLAGLVNLYADSLFEIGNSGTPIPSTSTASLEFANAVNVDFGIEARLASVFRTYGNAITQSALLAADASATATSLTTNVSTNWLNGNVIGLASTTRTAAETESKALTANAAGTTLTIAALTNAHSGTSPTQAELINLTRNVKIFGTSLTLQTYINCVTTSIVDINNTELYFLGSNTTNKRGISVATSTGTFNISGCALHDFGVSGSLGVHANSSANNNITVTNNNLYRIANNSIITTATSGTNCVYTGNIAMQNTTAGSTLLSFSDLVCTITNNIATGGVSTGILFGDIAFTSGTISGNIAHSNAGLGFSLSTITSQLSGINGTILNSTAWRNNTTGMTLTNVLACQIDGYTSFGNNGIGLSFTGSVRNVTLKNLNCQAGTVLASTTGLGVSSDTSDIIIENSVFGNVTTHSTADVNITAANIYSEILFKNCLFGSTTEFLNINGTNSVPGSEWKSQRHDQTAGNHRTFKKYGTILIDTTIFNFGSPSARLTPNSASNKLEGSVLKIPVVSGTTASVSMWTRKSSVGDGTAYTGNQPRLILKANPAAGINSDVVLDTMTVATGIWEQLVGTTPVVTDNAVLEILVDCDGVAGWVNYDDFSAT